MAADGSVLKSKIGWTLSQSGNHGYELIDKVKSILNYGLPIRTHKTAYADAHSITVISRQMVSDLANRFLIMPNKTLTLRWPVLKGLEAAYFLRGYIDGDGCVNKYPNGRNGADMLSISFVGTKEFISGARDTVHSKGRVQVIQRCENLVDLRWSGRFALDAGNWIYQSEQTIPITPKAQRFLDYKNQIALNQPEWLKVQIKRAEARKMFMAGVQIAKIARQIEVHIRTIYRWSESWKMGKM